MKKNVKQVVGIDVAQKELVVSLGRMYDDFSPEIYAHKSFGNTAQGFVSLFTWVKKMTDATVDLSYVMEATGVYHESLAYVLHQQNRKVSVVVPNKISNYFRTLDVKTVTDKIKTILHPDGFTFGWNHGRAAGQMSEHLHMHIIPRHENDGGGSIHSVIKLDNINFEEIAKKFRN